MKQGIIVYGIGEIGSVMARGFLKLGHPVFPVTNETSLSAALEVCPNPQLILVAVGEASLPNILARFPKALNDKLVLIQNELLPRDWQHIGLETPTVISVWFEKKRGIDSQVVVPSPVYGKHSQLIIDALKTLDLPAFPIDSESKLLFELIRKNLYILTTNIAGLRTGGTVRELWENHRDTAESVIEDVLSIQAYLTGQTLDKNALIESMLISFNGDPNHSCMGRSAPARLSRAISIADEAKLEVPTLRTIQSEAT